MDENNMVISEAKKLIRDPRSEMASKLTNTELEKEKE